MLAVIGKDFEEVVRIEHNVSTLVASGIKHGFTIFVQQSCKIALQLDGLGTPRRRRK